jgi:hypothetical protein
MDNKSPIDLSISVPGRLTEEELRKQIGDKKVDDIIDKGKFDIIDEEFGDDSEFDSEEDRETYRELVKERKSDPNQFAYNVFGYSNTPETSRYFREKYIHEANPNSNNNGNNGNGNGKSSNDDNEDKDDWKDPLAESKLNSSPSIEKISPNIDLDPHIPDRDYAEYYINVAKKTVRREDSFVRQVFYTALSKDSDDPLNLAVLAKTSAGKSYGINETLKYFNDKNIWFIGSMTPKVLVRQNGILVDANYQPLKPQIKVLNKCIEDAKKKKDTDQVAELEEELESLLEDAKVLIELGGLC